MLCILDSTCQFNVNEIKAAKLTWTDLNIWDEEATIMHNSIEAIDRTLKGWMHINLSFWRQAILCLGDFKKILLVALRGFIARNFSSRFKRSSLFSFFKE